MESTDIIGDVGGRIHWNLLLDMNGGPNHRGPDECEGADKCGFDSMILADTDNQILYPQLIYYYVGHIRYYIDTMQYIVYCYLYSTPVSLFLVAL